MTDIFYMWVNHLGESLSVPKPYTSHDQITELFSKRIGWGLGDSIVVGDAEFLKKNYKVRTHDQKWEGEKE